MIGSSKITEQIIRENALEHKKKKTGLNANRPSNNCMANNGALVPLFVLLSRQGAWSHTMITKGNVDSSVTSMDALVK